MALAHIPGSVVAYAAGDMSSGAGESLPGVDDASIGRGRTDSAAGSNRVITGDSSPPGSAVQIRKRIRADHVHASLEQAYTALLAKDVEAAADTYRQVLGHDPRNRDALVGLAAVAARAGRWGEAAELYARVLAFHPADPIAQAALISIDGPGAKRGESRLNELLLREPRAAYLHFTRGNLFAGQSRWSEARQSYFNAYRLDAGNPDYAHNLAVSLDHLADRGSALDFYREALVLAQGRSASFEIETVLARIRTIETAPRRDHSSARLRQRLDDRRSGGVDQ